MLLIIHANFFRKILTRSVVLFIATAFCFAPTIFAATKSSHHAATHKASKKHVNKKSHTKTHHKHVAKHSKPKHHAQLRAGNTEKPEQNATATDAPVKPLDHDLAAVNLNNISQSSPSLNLMFSMKKNLVSFVKRTVENLHYSSYKLGGSKFDTERGVYVVDCSNFVDRVLENVYPNAYLSLVNSTGTDNPASRHYFNFIRDLNSDESDGHWNKINDLDKLQAGDVLVFRYKNARGNETGGHVMVVMDQPERVDDVYFVRIADSAPSRHSEDTRHQNESGIGIGTLLLKANPKTGAPSAYAWGVNSDWNKKVKIAMARPIELNAS